MSTLYLLTQGTKAQLQSERIVITKNKEMLWSIPLNDVESVVIGRNAQITTQAIYGIVQQGGHIFYIDGNGKVYATMGSEQISLKRLRKQFLLFEEPATQLKFAKFILGKKIRSQRNLLRSYSKSNPCQELKETIKALDTLIGRVKKEKSLDKVRGLEGNAAKNYFDVFGLVIKADGFCWQGRYKHPAPDPVNALLSYGYYFLEREVRIAIAAYGADARIGFLHSNNERKDSLVYDLMEMFRASVSDRFVLKLINKKRIKPDLFIDLDGRVLLTEEGRRIWCECYEKYMQKEMSELNGSTPRKWIRNQVRAFLKEVVFGK